MSSSELLRSLRDLLMSMTAKEYVVRQMNALRDQCLKEEELRHLAPLPM